MIDFAVHQIISKWLRMQKCRQDRKSVRQRDRSERRNCQRKCSMCVLVCPPPKKKKPGYVTDPLIILIDDQ